jgi:branched-subunit amino acid aminotransferase/4-amino-4-deoxychorismate lyase
MELNGRTATIDDIAPLALYNYGNFTTILVDKLQVRGLGLHLERLSRDTRQLFGEGLDIAQVKTYVRHAVRDRQGPIVVRITVFCKDFSLIHPAKDCQPDVLITTRPAPSTPLPPVSLQSVTYQRDLPELKTTSIGSSLYRRRLAQQAGFDDALFINDKAEVSEGPTWNIGFFRQGRVVLPDTPSLSGVSMQLLRQALGKSDVTVDVKTVRLDDLGAMDGAFVASATNGFRSVTAIDKHTFQESPLLDTLREYYQAILAEEL